MLSITAWQPHLSITSAVAEFDWTDAGSYTVTSGAPDTLTSITNKKSGDAWDTMVNAFPRYEATGLNGLPCMRINGGGDLRGLVSTEAAVFGAFNGEDASTTLVVVIEPLAAVSFAAFGVGNSAVTSNSTSRVGVITNRIHASRVDDAGVLDELAPATHPGTLLEPQVWGWVANGTAHALYRGTVVASTSVVDVGVLTANRAALGVRPDNSPDLAMNGRMAALLVCNSALDGDLVRVSTRYMARHGIWS